MIDKEENRQRWSIFITGRLVLPPGFEPESQAREACMIGRTTLREPLVQRGRREPIITFSVPPEMKPTWAACPGFSPAEKTDPFSGQCGGPSQLYFPLLEGLPEDDGRGPIRDYQRSKSKPQSYIRPEPFTCARGRGIDGAR